MSTAESWTVGRLLQWTTDYLKAHGSESPRLDAEVLLAHVLGCQRIELYTSFEDEARAEARTAFRELVRRRAEGAPVAYLVGRREFYSLSFKVTPDVLIPRPETELLVVAAIDAAKAYSGEASAAGGDAPLAIVDVGTGSGVIAICLAKHLPHCRLTAIDLSPAALAVARENAQAHDVSARIEFFQGDLLAGIPESRQLDIVVSNPPYVSAAEMENLAPEVRNYEPAMALHAGPRGTEVIESLVPQAAAHLRRGGSLFVEISPMIHDAVQELLETDDRFEVGPTIKDLARLPRVVQATRR